jgi:hypothetical protein
LLRIHTTLTKGSVPWYHFHSTGHSLPPLFSDFPAVRRPSLRFAGLSGAFRLTPANAHPKIEDKRLRGELTILEATHLQVSSTPTGMLKSLRCRPDRIQPPGPASRRLRARVFIQSGHIRRPSCISFEASRDLQKRLVEEIKLAHAAAFFDLGLCVGEKPVKGRLVHLRASFRACAR